MVYIHIPFCGSFCTYCDFYSEIAVGDCFDSYADALCMEMEARRDEFPYHGETLYVGGGTPSVLPPEVFSKVAHAAVRLSGYQDFLCSGAGGPPFREFTVEVNPEDIVMKGRGFVEALGRAGVNRISMGVQSFDDGILRWMNRRHDGAGAENALRIIREAGVTNISIDLIFGISHLDSGLWRRTVEKATGLGVQHISAYQLSVEPGSALAGMVRTGKYAEAPESLCREQYDILCSVLGSAGYHHYEISNFALPGFEAVHNSAYWRHVPYAGFGPGAHSLRITDVASSGEGVPEPVYVRSWNSPDLRCYMTRYSGDGGNAACPVSGSETLSSAQVAIERIMLGLRTDRGVDEKFLARHADRARMETMLDRGFLVRSSEPGFLRIPESCFFISDSIISDII